MKKLLILATVLSALLIALPVRAGSAIPYANYEFHCLGEGYFDYGGQNDWSDDGWSFLNLMDRTWVSTKPSWRPNKDGPKIPLRDGFDRTIAYAINDAEQIVGYSQRFLDMSYPPTFPFVWDPPTGSLEAYADQEAGTTTILAGVQDYEVLFTQIAGAELRYFYPKDISNDGSLIVGCAAKYGIDLPGESTPWVWDETSHFLTLPVDEGFARPCAFLIAESEDDGYGPAIYGLAIKDHRWHKVKWTPLAFLEVEIDIKPGSDPNSINLGSKGVIPVAILGSATFNAADVDPSTVTLEGAPVRPKGKSGKYGSLEDINNDGDLDLVVHVVDFSADSGSTAATLTGELFDGTPIRGTDDIWIVR